MLHLTGADGNSDCADDAETAGYGVERSRSYRNEPGFLGNSPGMLMFPERRFPFIHGPARDLVNAKPDPAVSAKPAKL